jgi:hypothetical protein
MEPTDHLAQNAVARGARLVASASLLNNQGGRSIDILWLRLCRRPYFETGLAESPATYRPGRADESVGRKAGRVIPHDEAAAELRRKWRLGSAK